MSKKVTKAVIAAAGMGTRFLPQTKAMPKEMLPVVDKPVIQYVVEGLVEAGVEDIIIVTGPTKRAIEDHFDRSMELEQSLKQKGKEDIAETLLNISDMANFIYIRQKGEPAGNARPVLNAAHILGDEPFFFFFADDFFSGDISAAQQMQLAYEKVQAPIVAVRQVPKEEISTYGIVKTESDLKDGMVRVSGVAEKPSVNDAPSDLAVAGGYLLTPDIIPILQQEKVADDGEVRISDAFEELASIREAYGVIIQGDYHDTGNPVAHIKTMIEVALKDPRYKDDIQDFISNL